MNAYTEYMWSMFDDFKANARDVYGFDGIFCLSRSSSSGRTYHYASDYPHMFWLQVQHGTLNSSTTTGNIQEILDFFKRKPSHLCLKL